MNNFRYARPPQSSTEGSYTVGYGRYRDIRYRIARVRGKHLAVYIGLAEPHPLFGANLAQLKEVLPQIDWSYAASELLYANRTEEPLWWVGWIYDKVTPSVEEVNTTAKTIITELAKGAIRGEISPHH